MDIHERERPKRVLKTKNDKCPVSILKNVHFAKQKLKTYIPVCLMLVSTACIISAETINNIYKLFLSINKNRSYYYLWGANAGTSVNGQVT